MKKEFLTLAHHYNPHCFVKNTEWLASRKLNGWSCLWDGGVTRGQIAASVSWYYMGRSKPTYSTGLWTLGRGNKPKVIHAPNWWLDELPKEVPIHGELWKDDDLELVKSICGQGVKGRVDSRWENIKLMAYNVKPYSLLGLKKMWESKFYENTSWVTRIRHAKVMGSKYVDWVTQTPVYSSKEFDTFFENAVNQGWEGAMLVNPYGYYKSHRSYDLLKRKPVFEDVAEVIGYEDGKTGKTLGKMGSIAVKHTWDEKVLTVPGGRYPMINQTVMFGVSGWEDGERDWDYVKATYPIGSEIHFKYNGVTKDGIPISPNVWRDL